MFFKNTLIKCLQPIKNTQSDQKLYFPYVFVDNSINYTSCEP